MKTAGCQENTASYGSNTERKLQNPSGFNRLILHQKLGKYFSESAPLLLRIYFNTATPLSRKKTIPLWTNTGSLERAVNSRTW